MVTVLTATGVQPLRRSHSIVLDSCTTNQVHLQWSHTQECKDEQDSRNGLLYKGVRF